MKFQQVSEFKIFDRSKSQIAIMVFSRKPCEQFLAVKREQNGKLIFSELVSESFAKTVLDQAILCLPKEDLEITFLSTGTSFNYPRKTV